MDQQSDPPPARILRLMTATVEDTPECWGVARPQQVLVTIYDDGTAQVAVRSTHHRDTWGMPAWLVDEEVF